MLHAELAAPAAADLSVLRLLDRLDVLREVDAITRELDDRIERGHPMPIQEIDDLRRRLSVVRAVVLGQVCAWLVAYVQGHVVTVPAWNAHGPETMH